MTYAEDKRRRDLLGIGEYQKYLGGIARFENLSNENFNLLAIEGFVDPGEAQSDISPCAGEFKNFMNKYPGVTAHGYIVSPERSDCRLTIEGLDYKGPVSSQMMADFTEMCRYADEFYCDTNGFYCWYD